MSTTARAVEKLKNRVDFLEQVILMVAFNATRDNKVAAAVLKEVMRPIGDRHGMKAQSLMDKAVIELTAQAEAALAAAEVPSQPAKDQ